MYVISVSRPPLIGAIPIIQCAEDKSALFRLPDVYATTSEQTRAWPRIGRRQHLACCPPSTVAQMLMKSVLSVGVSGGAAQSRSATPSTSVAQQSGVVYSPVVQTACWRFSAWKAGIAWTEVVARTAAARMVVNCILNV